jgi:hypothetical protein
MEKKRRLTIPWVNLIGLPFLIKGKIDSVISLRREEHQSKLISYWILLEYRWRVS